MITDVDLQNLKSAIAASRSARDKGNQPYGAILVSADGEVLLTAEVWSKDCTAHAETNLIRQASSRLEAAVIRGCPSSDDL